MKPKIGRWVWIEPVLYFLRIYSAIYLGTALEAIVLVTTEQLDVKLAMRRERYGSLIMHNKPILGETKRSIEG